jgi:hypothetical protein
MTCYLITGGRKVELKGETKMRISVFEYNYSTIKERDTIVDWLESNAKYEFINPKLSRLTGDEGCGIVRVNVTEELPRQLNDLLSTIVENVVETIKNRSAPQKRKKEGFFYRNYEYAYSSEEERVIIEKWMKKCIDHELKHPKLKCLVGSTGHGIAHITMSREFEGPVTKLMKKIKTSEEYDKLKKTLRKEQKKPEKTKRDWKVFNYLFNTKEGAKKIQNVMQRAYHGHNFFEDKSGSLCPFEKTSGSGKLHILAAEDFILSEEERELLQEIPLGKLHIPWIAK